MSTEEDCIKEAYKMYQKTFSILHDMIGKYKKKRLSVVRFDGKLSSGEHQPDLKYLDMLFGKSPGGRAEIIS